MGSMSVDGYFPKVIELLIVILTLIDFLTIHFIYTTAKNLHKAL